jgi:hypothetical protein
MMVQLTRRFSRETGLYHDDVSDQSRVWWRSPEFVRQSGKDAQYRVVGRAVLQLAQIRAALGFALDTPHTKVLGYCQQHARR